MPPSAASTTFSYISDQATLYLPIGSKENYSAYYPWSKFNKLCEEALTVEDTDGKTAYLLMNIDKMSYMVYDLVSNDLKEVEYSSDITKTDANNSWMTTTIDGKSYLYNLGARKFVRATVVGFELCDNAVSLRMSNGADGITIADNIGQWSMVKNPEISGTINLEELASVEEIKIFQEKDIRYIYDIDGRRTNEIKGVSIVRMYDGSVKKVLK